MNESMAVAPPLPISFKLTFHENGKTWPNGREGMESTDQNQHFGRYEGLRSPRERSPSSRSLEAIALFLSQRSQSPEPHELLPSVIPVGRSETSFTTDGFTAFSNKPELRKTRSFPISLLKPRRSSLLSPDRPPLEKSRSVRFADSQGLPLTSVRQLTAADPFETEGEIVPRVDDELGRLHLTRRLPVKAPKNPPRPVSPPMTHTRLLQFVQPGTQPDFFSRLRSRNVILESVKSEARAVHGIVRVVNLDYDKEVCVRWTHDNWKTSHNSTCSYCKGSNDGGTDRFAFTLPANGDDIQFAIRYRCAGKEYWDNNGGQNYVIVVQR